MHWETRKYVWLALLRYSLYCSDLELNLQYLWGIACTVRFLISICHPSWSPSTSIWFLKLAYVKIQCFCYEVLLLLTNALCHLSTITIHHYHIVQNNLITLQISCTISIQFFPRPKLLRVTDLLNLCWVLPFPECHIIEIMQHAVFSEWLPSPSKVHLRFIHIFFSMTSIAYSFYYWITFHFMDVLYFIYPCTAFFKKK